MNYSIIRRTTGLVLKFEAVFLLLPAVTGFLYRERAGMIYLALAAAVDVEARNILIERNLRLVAHIMNKS